MTGHRAGSTQPSEAVQQLRAQLAEMSGHLEGLEKERDFYFAKVRLSFHPSLTFCRVWYALWASHNFLPPSP